MPPSLHTIVVGSTSAAVRVRVSLLCVHLTWAVSAGSGSVHVTLSLPPTRLHGSELAGAEGGSTRTMHAAVRSTTALLALASHDPFHQKPRTAV